MWADMFHIGPSLQWVPVGEVTHGIDMSSQVARKASLWGREEGEGVSPVSPGLKHILLVQGTSESKTPSGVPKKHSAPLFLSPCHIPGVYLGFIRFSGSDAIGFACEYFLVERKDC